MHRIVQTIKIPKDCDAIILNNKVIIQEKQKLTLERVFCIPNNNAEIKRIFDACEENMNLYDDYIIDDDRLFFFFQARIEVSLDEMLELIKNYK